MLNRIAFIFYFFIFLGEAGGAREYHTALPSALFSTGFHFPSYLMFLAAVFTLTKRITVKPALLVCFLRGSFIFAHAFFSALCFYPLKHAPLIFGEEDQA